MMDYRSTYRALEQMYFDCVKFWKNEGKNNMVAHQYAMKDIESMNRDPFSPNGEELDPKAKHDFYRHYN